MLNSLEIEAIKYAQDLLETNKTKEAIFEIAGFLDDNEYRNPEDFDHSIVKICKLFYDSNIFLDVNQLPFSWLSGIRFDEFIYDYQKLDKELPHELHYINAKKVIIRNFDGSSWFTPSLNRCDFDEVIFENCSFTTIPSNYFYLCRLGKVVLPDSINKLESKAFYECKIEDIYFSNTTLTTELQALRHVYSSTFHAPKHSDCYNKLEEALLSCDDSNKLIGY